MKGNDPDETPIDPAAAPASEPGARRGQSIESTRAGCCFGMVSGCENIDKSCGVSVFVSGSGLDSCAGDTR